MDVTTVTSGLESIWTKICLCLLDTSSQIDNTFSPHNDLEAAEKMYSIYLSMLWPHLITPYLSQLVSWIWIYSAFYCMTFHDFHFRFLSISLSFFRSLKCPRIAMLRWIDCLHSQHLDEVFECNSSVFACLPSSIVTCRWIAWHSLNVVTK